MTFLHSVNILLHVQNLNNLIKNRPSKIKQLNRKEVKKKRFYNKEVNRK